MIPVRLITVVNPRVGSKRIFKQIVAKVAELGLKRPVMLAWHENPNGSPYDLVCGQGRLEAYRRSDSARFPPSLLMLTPRTD
jgi:ParB family chromosome partitioning protein